MIFGSKPLPLNGVPVTLSLQKGIYSILVTDSEFHCNKIPLILDSLLEINKASECVLNR